MIIENIDKGKSFDWGRTSLDYAKYRDIYPQEFYDCILELGLCRDGEKVLDIGTGTGVLPRNMYRFGAKWTGTDISANQIEQAKLLAKEVGMDIDFFVAGAEDVDFPDNTFDVITACQCIWYLNHAITAPQFAKMLKPGGKFLILYMGWLPYEDAVAGKSEEIILKHNPNWTSSGDTCTSCLGAQAVYGLFYLADSEGNQSGYSIYQRRMARKDACMQGSGSVYVRGGTCSMG